MDEVFAGAVEEAKKLERKIVEYAPYAGDISIDMTLDLEPRDYVDLNYGDLLNSYERVQKIISTAGMGILAQKAEAAPAETSAQTGEVESRLRELTSQTLKQAEEVGKEPIVIQKEAEPAPLEFERPSEPKIEFETKKASEIVPPSMKEEAAAPSPVREERAAAPAVEKPAAEAPMEKKVIVASVPPVLRESPDQAASKRYEQMEEQIRSAVGEKADETTIKKKMLDLTKQLFKEKSFNRREEIKIQITALKNMLAAAQSPAPSRASSGAAAKKGARTDDAHAKILDTMLSTHQSEIAQTKDSITDSYNKQIAAIKKKFYEDLSGTEDAAKRKQIFEGFVFSVTSLVEQLPEVIKKYDDFTSKKHSAELDKLRESLGADEKDLQSSVEERLAYVKKGYAQEFASVKGIIGRDIENLIEVAGNEIFKKAEEKPKESEERVFETVKEINDTDEGTLLYFLHNKDTDYYKRYERKQISKAEAIFKAKALMAKEKGLDDTAVKKYFSQSEG
ncbi:MAG TPA: hypothetical protein VLD37_04855 [Candidatus Bilamarchaeum sp.]|nr:hypothetical protein [Candidatus Bilamarchaeum sp.]